jgi:oligopeptide transport system ATP-binding protein
MKICLSELPDELDINDFHKASCWMNVKQVYDEAAADAKAVSLKKEGQ